MPDSEALAYAAKLIGGIEDSTDLMQDVENFLEGEIDWDAKDRAEQVDRLTGPVTEIVSKALSEVSAMLILKAQRQSEERRIQEMRVAAVITQFKLTNPDGYVSEEDTIDIPSLTDALFGVNGVRGV